MWGGQLGVKPGSHRVDADFFFLGLTSLTKIKQRWLSTPVAGALMTNKSNMGQAGPTAVAAVKGLAWL